MVASTHSPDDLGVSPIASASQQNFHHHHHHNHHPHHHYPHHPSHQHQLHNFPSHAKSAQDKRSRLSNLINNLLKKVPAAPEASSSGKADATTTTSPATTPVATTSTQISSSSSCSSSSSSSNSGGERNLETLEKYVMTVLSSVTEEKIEEQKQQQPSSKHENDDEGEAKLDRAAALPPSDDQLAHQPKDDVASPKSLGDIILERLSDEQQTSLVPKQEPKNDADDDELRSVCQDLLDDLLTSVQKEAESTQSLHCSLPLDKVASVLQSPVTVAAAAAVATTPTSTPDSKPTTTTPTTTTPVRQLCLYCDRKFSSISLRQKHTERVHQASLGGRRSERNGSAASRKSNQQTCQYCVDRCSDNLEGLFQHLVGSHSDKYHGCLQCSTRYLTHDALATHNRETHPQPVLVVAPVTTLTHVKDEQQQPQQQQQPPAPVELFDSNFYNNVSCNIRENLLHHLDGKLQADPPESSKTSQYNAVDISLTAVTPVYAPVTVPMTAPVVATPAEQTDKPKSNNQRAHPRRVSFEKYNFPSKYDGKEQWSCAIKDLSRFDISTQLSLRKKQRSLKDNGQTMSTTDAIADNASSTMLLAKQSEQTSEEQVRVNSECASVNKDDVCASDELGSYLRLKKNVGVDVAAVPKKETEIVYAELTGEWARPRIYICGACADRYTTMKELEDHKLAAHPNVWCMHFEFSGDQRELYKHLVFLPGIRSSSPTPPSMKTRSQQPSERVCTKCNKSCASLAELHRHMLECGGDQAWLLGLFGNGKKKCKWRPFGSRSRRRRQRGMKRNIQNSQTPRNNTPRERPSYSGPRVRPSDRESIQKMLANLPAKRATRTVLQENAARSQGRLRNLQSRARAVDNPASRMVKSKAVLRNKLLKNAKSFQRKKNLREEKQHEVETEQDSAETPVEPTTRRGKHMRKVRVVSKKKNVTLKESTAKHVEQPKRRTIKLRSSEAVVVEDDDDDDETEEEEEEEQQQQPKKKTTGEYVSGRKLKRRILNPLTSINASLKAKSQLRTNDGKFARKKLIAAEPIVSLDVKSVKISKRSVNDTSRLLTRSKLRAAATSAWKEHAKLSKRITRLRSSDGDEVETDSTDKEDNVVEKISQVVTVVTKAKIGRPSLRRSLDAGDNTTTDKSMTEQPLVPIIGRGRRPKKDMSEARINNESSASKSNDTEPKTRSQRLSSNGEVQSKPRRTVTFKDERDAETPKKNSKSALDVTSSSDAEPAEEKIVKRRNSKTKESNNKKTPKESGDKKTGKRAQKDAAESKKAATSSEEKSLADVESNDSSPLKKEKVLRKSQRNKDLDTKDATEESELKSKEATTNEEMVIESANEPEKNDADVESVSKKTLPVKRRGRVKRSVSNAEEIKPSDEVSIVVDKQDKVESEAAEVSKESIVEPEAANLTSSEISSENNDSSIVSSEDRSDNSNAQNLSLEALQQESSNSNMDSGKENSSEAIANLSKLKVVRPKKARGRKDKTVTSKRSLNSVIGILTEGVNVPSESQDSTIVLTAQTAVEPVVSSNTQINCQSSDQTTLENSISSSTESKLTDDCENTSDKLADVGDVSANAAVPIAAALQQTNEETPAAVVFEEIVTKKQDEPTTTTTATEVSEKESTPVLPKISCEVAKEIAPVVEPPANDIILDLSRRKPKGKGSFLEKIVSKIAKQKDVSLDGDGHLDIAHLSSSTRKNLENTKQQTTHTQEIYSTKIDEIKAESALSSETSVNVNETVVNIVNSKANVVAALIDENIEKSVDTSMSTLDSVSKSINENSQAISVKTADVSISSSDINESESKLVDKPCEAMNGVVEKIDSNVSIDLDNKLPVTTEKESSESTVKQKPKQKQKSKKRSLDSVSPMKNKKKPLGDDTIEDIDEEEEICLADIMKLLDRTKSAELPIDEIEKIEAEAVKPGKRKTPDDEASLESLSTDINAISSMDNPQETSRKSKRKSGQKKNKSIEHSKSFNEACNGSQIEQQIDKIDKDNSDVSELQINGTIPISEQLEVTQEKNSSEDCNNLTENQVLSVEQNSEKIENEVVDQRADESFKIPESTELSKAGRKRTSRRRSRIEISGSDQESEKDEDDNVEKQSTEDNDIDPNSSMSESEEKSTNNYISKRTTRNSRHVTYDESIDNTSNIKESDDSDVSSVTDIEPSRRRRSQRKNIDSSRDVSVSSVDENLQSWEIKPERKSMSRKAKKIVAIVDESDSETSIIVDSPLEPENMTIEKLNSEQISQTQLEDEKVQTVVESLSHEITGEIDSKSADTPVSEVKEAGQEEKSSEILNVEENLEIEKEISAQISSTAEESQQQQSSIDETLETTNKQEFTLPSELSSYEHDESSNLEMQAPKKRVAGNFAIVTKSGKILIVEKKKKLTKEAAKFFCEVCSTSFTRKSSLKKHNSSQSHLLQVTMHGDKIKEAAKEVEAVEQVTPVENLDELAAETIDRANEKESQIVEENEIETPVEKEMTPSVEHKEETPDKLQVKESEETILENSTNEPTTENNVVQFVEPVSAAIIIPEPARFLHKSPEEELEDEMLDEEICKITENMSHDEYVLTDHVSPLTPEAASTPVTEVASVAKNPVASLEIPTLLIKAPPKKKKKDKKKINLADEHLSLDTPVPIKVTEPQSSSVVDALKEPNVDSILSVSTPNDTQTVGKIDESLESSTVQDEENISCKSETKSKKTTEKKNSNDGKRSSRNRNQNSKQEDEINISESSRPKRNQLRPSYKEDDFDLIESPNESTEEQPKETLKSKRDKSNASACPESEQSDFQRDSQTKAKELSAKQNKNNQDSVEIADDEKDISGKKQKTKKNQARNGDKEIDNTEDLEISLIEKDALETELNDIEDINFIKSKVESNEVKDVAIELTEDIIAEDIEPAKKKRGRKPKNVKVDTEKSLIQGDLSIDTSKDSIVQSILDKELDSPIVPEKLTNVSQKQSKSRRSQNKRKSKNTIEVVKSADTSLTELTEKNSFTDETEISIQSLPVDQSISEKISDDITKQSHLKTFDEAKTDVASRSMLSDFDSDENSLDTTISVDIQKLLDDPEMTTEIAKETDDDSQSTATNVDVMNVKKPITPTVSTDVREESNKAEKSSSKSGEDKKAKKRGRKPKNSVAKPTNDVPSLSETSEVEEEEEDEEKTEDKPQRSKSKIVKSVFGRVFGAEKVKEVLDDWQSRSDTSDDSANEEVEKTTRKSRSSKHQRNVKKSSETVGRSRQSKKRAEELISRAFNDDSPVHGESRAAKNLRLSRKNQVKSVSPVKNKSEDEENEGSGEDSEEEEERFSKLKRGKKRSKDLDVSSLESKQAKYQSNDEDELEMVDNTEDSQVSQSTLDKVQSELDNTETEELNGRLSPTYSSNEDDDTLRSSSDDEDNQKHKKRRSSELLTIEPTDAVEDNAQDLEMPVNKPKVLNFDEELFVECCSRLKATSEKEFRNAKKIKLDHSVDHQTTGYTHHHKKDEQIAYRKDRWRDVESQNSLGSLLESVNQLLGEEYNSQEKDYSLNASKRRHHSHGHHHHHHHHHHHNRRHESPERNLLERTADEDNMGYDDSLDVAFEHNNKLRDKIQQRMRESEDLIATSFGQKNNSSDIEARYNSYTFDATVNDRHSKTKPSNGIDDGLLDKTLSNFFHEDKRDHPSTPMNLLAELACARAPSATTPTIPETSKRPSHKDINVSIDDKNQFDSKVIAKKPKNPIKELFERKNELNEKKQLMTKLKISSPKSSDKPKKQKKVKNTQHNLPVIRTSQFRGGLVERKKRRDNSFFGKKKDQSTMDRVKDIYDFDDEESASDPGVAPVMSYRNKADGPKELNMSALLSKTIGDTLTNGKSVSAIGENLQNMLDRKFKDVENYESVAKSPVREVDEAVKTVQRTVIGPMDDFVERRQKSKRSSGEHSTGKHSSKSKKKAGKSSKKKSRNAWYENDSSDEFVTKLKADDVGVGISKSQRTCSKGKQNLFAEISSTSSESDLEDDAVPYRKKRPSSAKKLAYDKETNGTAVKEAKDEESWPIKKSNAKRSSLLIDHDNKKSESELSDHPLVIDENQKEEHQTNSDDEPEERTFELDDLYREDSSIVDSDRDESSIATEEKSNSLVKPTDALSHERKPSPEKYISIEDALELLDRPEEQQVLAPAKKEKSSTASKSSIPEVFQKAQKPQSDESQDDEEENLPEKLSSNEKPQRQPENLPLHVFLSRKVQESKKRKQQQELKKLMEEQERIMLDMQPARRQRKCAIGKQGLLAEISSSDEELSVPYRKKSAERSESHEKPRSKQRQRESKEKRKERYLEKKHEQMIAKEQKAIEEEIMRELEEKRLSAASEASSSEKDEKKQTLAEELSSSKPKISTAKHNKANSRKQKNHESLDDSKRANSSSRIVTTDSENDDANTPVETSFNKKKRPAARSPQKAKKIPKTSEAKTPSETKKTKQNSSSPQKRSKTRPTSASRSKEMKEQRSQSGKRESDLDDDEELKAAKSWNKLDEGVGVAIGRRKRAAANQLYYWSSSSEDEEEPSIPPPPPVIPPNPPAVPVEGPEDDKLQQHGWIVGDSHKKMITMLAMEKQLKEKRRRSENDEQPPGATAGSPGGKGKSKKHRNSTS